MNAPDSQNGSNTDSASLTNENLPPQDGGPSEPSDNGGAYLVLNSAGRWSDVFRLSPPAEAILGRGSQNQIVVRSDQASRKHARIFWSGESWLIQDMGSRNGTFVNGQKISSDRPLANGDTVEIAGYGIQFTNRIEGTSSPALSDAARQATEDQLTMEMDPDAILDRRRHSHFLSGGLSERPNDRSAQSLLQLAFQIARSERTSGAIDFVLETLAQNLTFGTAGAYLSQPTKADPSGTVLSVNDLNLVGTRQSGSRSYRRPPDPLVAAVAGAEGQAVLARNVLGDPGLATENSHGEIDAESVVLAPVRDRDNCVRGLLHLTTTAGEAPLATSDLEFVVACAEILAESLAGLATRKKLNRSLRRSRRQVKQLQELLGDKARIIGCSEPIDTVIQQVGLAAPTNATVLIRGESGVGKELVAAAVHYASPRKDASFVCMNCAALSPSLLESELFGHEKGAFTGATDRKQGKFELADGGTLMLDEIGEMNLEIQAKFLRVLEGHAFERVGGQAPIRVDVRVIAATNRDLQAMVAEGLFRQDLFYRLHVVEILVPPLRKRGKDVIELAEHFLADFNRQMGRKIDGFTDPAKKRLLAYSWPGNVRELKNVVERAVVLNTKDHIEESDLVLAPAFSAKSELATTSSDQQPVEVTLAELERAHIERVLLHTERNKSRAATILGIERSTLDRKLKKFAKLDAEGG